jgi:hypothetical protein
MLFTDDIRQTGTKKVVSNTKNSEIPSIPKTNLI